MYACTFPTQDFTFQDVPPTNNFNYFIEYLSCQGVISGYTCGGTPSEPCLPPLNRPSFRWGNTTTRGQFAKILSNAMRWAEPIATTQQTFQDIPSSNPFWIFVERSVLHGAISGYNCGGPNEPCVAPGNKPYFRWGVNITRGQVAKSVTLARGWTWYVPANGVYHFADMPPSNTIFFGFIERIYEKGVATGYNCGAPGEPCVPPDNKPYFRAGNTVTRAQLSKMIVLGVTQP
jgi:hypothetical protein